MRSWNKRPAVMSKQGGEIKEIVVYRGFKRDKRHRLASFGGITHKNELRAALFTSSFNTALNWIHAHPYSEDAGLDLIDVYGPIIGTAATSELLAEWKTTKGDK